MRVDTGLSEDATVDIGAEAAQAQAEGYSCLWGTEVKHDPFLSLAIAASRTDTIQLGTSIALAFARNPMSMAVIANDLQQLSHGRLMLGLGSQVKAHITRRFSMPWSHPAARMREYVMAMRAIWASWADGSKLDFRGDFYSHTLMTPFFDPGPNPYGAARILLAGVGDLMTTAAGEVADGFLCHGFTTERYLREVTLPALTRGRGDDLTGFDIVGSPMVATGASEEELAAARDAARGRIAFYGSTPAYRPVMALHGWGELADELHTMSLTDRWAQMGALIDDDVLETFAVVGEPADIAPELHRRFADILTRATLYAPAGLDDGIAAGIARDLHALD
jgi:probable F420-dependent oxidoreductase